MSKEYAKGTSRSEEKTCKISGLREVSVDRAAQVAQCSVPLAGTPEQVGGGFESFCNTTGLLIITTGLLIIKSLLDEEREAVANKIGKHGSAARRWG